MLEIFMFSFFAICIVFMLLGWMDERKIKTVLVLILASGTTFAQLDPMTPPEPESEHFYLVCDFYITTTGADSTHYKKASIYMDSSEFFIIRGQDTTARRLCKFDPYYSELALSCGDWVRPVRNWAGEVYALWYREKGTTYYFNEKFVRRNDPRKE